VRTRIRSRVLRIVFNGIVAALGIELIVNGLAGRI